VAQGPSDLGSVPLSLAVKSVSFTRLSPEPNTVYVTVTSGEDLTLGVGVESDGFVGTGLVTGWTTTAAFYAADRKDRLRMRESIRSRIRTTIRSDEPVVEGVITSAVGASGTARHTLWIYALRGRYRIEVDCVGQIGGEEHSLSPAVLHVEVEDCQPLVQVHLIRSRLSTSLFCFQ
jgi:hypothetical protein